MYKYLLGLRWQVDVYIYVIQSLLMMQARLGLPSYQPIVVCNLYHSLRSPWAGSAKFETQPYFQIGFILVFMIQRYILLVKINLMIITPRRYTPRRETQFQLRWRHHLAHQAYLARRTSQTPIQKIIQVYRQVYCLYHHLTHFQSLCHSSEENSASLSFVSARSSSGGSSRSAKANPIRFRTAYKDDVMFIRNVSSQHRYCSLFGNAVEEAAGSPRRPRLC